MSETTSIERLMALSAKDLVQHVRNMESGCDWYERYVDKTSERALAAYRLRDEALNEQRRRYASLPVVVYPRVAVEVYSGMYELADATWVPYIEGYYADGRNGVLCGACVKRGMYIPGGGKLMTFEWAHLDKAWERYGMEFPTFHLVTCG